MSSNLEMTFAFFTNDVNVEEFGSHQTLIITYKQVHMTAAAMGEPPPAKPDTLNLVDYMRVIKGMGASTRVLVASLRSAGQLTALAEAGCDTFTFSPAIADELLYEPLTTIAAADFETAAVVAGGAPVVW